MHVILNGEPLDAEEVHYFKYLGSQVAADGGCERDVVHRMNEVYRARGALKSVLSNRGMGIKAKKCIHERVIVPTALYGAEAWGMRSAERRKVNVLEMKCLRSLVGVSRMDRVRNEAVRRSAGIERELASIEDQRVLRWFVHLERIYQRKTLEKHSLSIQYKTSNLSTECIQNQFLFLKDCTSKHVGPIESYKGF